MIREEILYAKLFFYYILYSTKTDVEDYDYDDDDMSQIMMVIAMMMIVDDFDWHDCNDETS